jgi:hypothetical protein
MNKKFGKWMWLAPFVFAGAVLLLGWAVMVLWNAILVPAAGLGMLSFWQGVGLLVLSRILVGGFGRRGMGWKGRQGMQEKWASMNPEERERFRQQWRSRCAPRFGQARTAADEAANTAADS